MHTHTHAACFLFATQVEDPEEEEEEGRSAVSTVEMRSVSAELDDAAASCPSAGPASAAAAAPPTARVKGATFAAACAHALAVVRLRAFWRALTFTAAVFLISKQWGDMDSLLPPYLERHFGEGVPIYTIHSINLWVCLPGPPIAAALTSHIETFRVMLPGLWLMALSPVYLVVYPSVASAALWILTLSAGEIFWSPRNYAFIAGLAPVGREGLFIGLLSLKDLFASIPSSALNGWLNEVYNPNCPTCRDRVGHFCDQATLVGSAALHNATAQAHLHNATLSACATSQGVVCVGDGFSAALIANGSAPLTCPHRGCHGCPGWDGERLASTLWLVVLLMSVTSPMAVMACLPFLRGERGSGPGPIKRIRGAGLRAGGRRRAPQQTVQARMIEHRIAHIGDPNLA